MQSMEEINEQEGFVKLMYVYFETEIHSCIAEIRKIKLLEL